MFFLIAFAPVCTHGAAAQTSRTDVSNFVAEDPRFIRLRITMQSSLVILRGTVESCDDKREAMKWAASIEGVKEVEDHIEVNAKRIPDRTLIHEIDQNLKDHNFRGMQFHVSKRVVTLRGTVPSDSDREQVVNLICGTAGVIDVNGQGVRVLMPSSAK